jgi:hypothetical protein
MQRAEARRSPKSRHVPQAESLGAESLDAPDTRTVLDAFDLLDEEGSRHAPVIAAASGFAVLVIYSDRKGRVTGYVPHVIVGWKLCHDGASPLPVCHSLHVPYHQMHDLAILNPDGEVWSFEGCRFKNAAAWMRDRQRVLVVSK